MQLDLIDLCRFPENQIWRLEYRASRDGFSSQSFHNKCDGIKNTLTVIKTTNGSIFGGYVEKPWTTRNIYVNDPFAFVFSLINHENRSFKVFCANYGKKAMSCDSEQGPSFGGGTDIRILSNSNANNDSYSSFGYSYKHPDYLCASDRAHCILAGTHHFQTLEIEVFSTEHP